MESIRARSVPNLKRGVNEMTARTWTVRIAAMAFVALPLPLPLPTPSLPLAVPSANIAVSPLPLDAPSVPALNTPGNQAAPTSVAPQGGGGSANHTAPPTDNPNRGIPIPFTAIYVSSPFDIALVGALVTLPLLFGIWLLLFGRTFNEARRARDAQIRLILAADLGLPPRDLTSMSTKALFNLREKSAFDELTGVLRRAAGISVAEREIARARRHNSPLTVGFVDLDGLKEANDRHGHVAGDALLRGLTHALKEGLRGEDAILRYGGDEFVCVLPDTSAPNARTTLGDIQAEAAKAGVRFCFGLAQLQRSDDVVSLFARADRELYDFKAKRGEIVQLPARDTRKERKRAGMA